MVPNLIQNSGNDHKDHPAVKIHRLWGKILSLFGGDRLPLINQQPKFVFLNPKILGQKARSPGQATRPDWLKDTTIAKQIKIIMAFRSHPNTREADLCEMIRDSFSDPSEKFRLLVKHAEFY